MATTLSAGDSPTTTDKSITEANINGKSNHKDLRPPPVLGRVHEHEQNRSCIMKGLSPGAALVMLMAGPAVNIAFLKVDLLADLDGVNYHWRCHVNRTWPWFPSKNK